MLVYGSEFFCLFPCKIRNLNIFGVLQWWVGTLRCAEVPGGGVVASLNAGALFASLERGGRFALRLTPRRGHFALRSSGGRSSFAGARGLRHLSLRLNAGGANLRFAGVAHGCF